MAQSNVWDDYLGVSNDAVPSPSLGTAATSTPTFTPNFQQSTVPEIKQVTPTGTDVFRKVDPAAVQDAATRANNGYQLVTSGGVPSGGNLRDPSYATQLVKYWSTQPGANPSLARDPNYWIQKITSGELGSDEKYVIQKFLTPEGAPAGSSASGYFDDPTAKLLEQAVLGRLDSLSKGLAKQQQDQYAAQLQADADNNAAIDDYVKALQGRVGELQAPVYSQGQEQLLRSKATDPIWAQRDATLKNSRENYLARTGFAPSSGGVTDLENTINKQFGQADTQVQSDLALNAITEQNRRADLATTIQGMIANARQTKSADRLASLSTLAQLEAGNNTQNEARQRETLSTAAILPELTAQRLQLALQTLGPNTDLSGLLSAITGANSVGNQSTAIANQNRQDTYTNLGDLLKLIFG